MSGPTSSVAQVPLSAVLPSGYAAAEGELRRFAHRLESHVAAVGNIRWHWYPEHTTKPAGQTEGSYLIVFDVSIMLFNEGSDWLELTLDVGWCPDLIVNAAVEVACWCSPDHNMHQVREGCWPVTNGHELVGAFSTGTAMLTKVLESGPFHPRSWRTEAGLPDPTSAAP